MKRMEELALTVLEAMYSVITADVLCCEISRHANPDQPGQNLCSKTGGEPKEYHTTRDISGEKMYVLCRPCAAAFSREKGLRTFDLPVTVKILSRLIKEKREQEEARQKQERLRTNRANVFSFIAGNGQANGQSVKSTADKVVPLKAVGQNK